MCNILYQRPASRLLSRRLLDGERNRSGKIEIDRVGPIREFVNARMCLGMVPISIVNAELRNNLARAKYHATLSEYRKHSYLRSMTTSCEKTK